MPYKNIQNYIFIYITYKKSYVDDIIEKYNFMTEILETRCLKILCKFGFVAQNT